VRSLGIALLLLCTVSAGCARHVRAPGDWFDGPRAPEPITIDDDVGDWYGITPILQQRDGSLVEAISAVDSPHYLYLSLALRDSVNLQAMPGTLHLLFRTGAAGGSGHTVYGVHDVDFAVDLSRLDKVQAGSRGAGMALRPATTQGLGEFLSPYDIDLAALPSWASDRFELRIARVPRGWLGHTEHVIHITPVFVTADSVVHRSPTVPYRLRTVTSAVPRSRIDTIFAPSAGALRVAQWNVSEGSFRKPEMHARLLAAVTPDVLLLDEVYEQITPDSLRRFFDLPALRALGPWQFVIGGSGGRQRTVVAARGRAIRPVESMASMRYIDGTLDSLRRITPPAAHRLIDIEEAAQISSVGAWVDVNGTEVMFVPLDLQSGGYAGSVHDNLRVLQAEAIRRYIRAEEMRRGDFPVVIAGDFNAVGSLRSVRLLSGELSQFPGVMQSQSMRLGEQSMLTWKSAEAAQFSPGQLDLTFFRGFRQHGGFVFTTEDLSDRLLAKLGMTRETFPQVSDHLIVVTDLVR
jgi:endonuclease/exonuclease/phosphatase family metal-dependent hydrolase